jgi:hypothetical protein
VVLVVLVGAVDLGLLEEELVRRSDERAVEPKPEQRHLHRTHPRVSTSVIGWPPIP